MKKERIFSCN